MILKKSRLQYFIILVIAFLTPVPFSLGQQPSQPPAQEGSQEKEDEFISAYEAFKKLSETRPSDKRVLFEVGRTAFLAGKMKASVDAFDELIKLDASQKPKLWQRGLALYYTGQFERGVRQFEVHQTYNTQDVENAVWHMLCNAKLKGVSKARNELIPIKRDRRKPMNEIHDLFAGKIEPAEFEKRFVSPVVGKQPDNTGYYAALYCGLYYQMLEEHKKAKRMMEQAEKLNPLPRNSIMGSVARVHLQLVFRIGKCNHKAKK